MPTRLLRDGIINSERVNKLDHSEEVFYRRLMSKVDDHGLYDARSSVLRTSLYPLRVDVVSEYNCAQWLTACINARLILLYQVHGKPFLKMLDTKWKARSAPKYLEPVNGCEQWKATVPLDVVVDVVRSRLIEDVVVDVVGDVAVQPATRSASPVPAYVNGKTFEEKTHGKTYAQWIVDLGIKPKRQWSASDLKLAVDKALEHRPASSDPGGEARAHE